MGDIYLIRNAQSLTPHECDDALSALGYQQAGAVAKALTRRTQPDYVISGNLRREMHTAEAFLDALQASPILTVDPGFNEFSYIDLLAALSPNFTEKAGVNRWLETQARPRRAFYQLMCEALERWTGGQHDQDYLETYQDFSERVIEALLRARDMAGPSKQVVVFTAGGAIAVICQWLLKLRTQELMKLAECFANTGVTKLRYDNQRINIATLNCTNHLESDEASLLTYR